MITEEPFITIEQLLKRWPGMPYDEIGDEITKLFKKKRNTEDDPFQASFPRPFIRQGVERRNPNTGNIVWNVEPSNSAPFDRGDINGGFDLDSYCFKVAEIEFYEGCHPEVSYHIVDADHPPESETANDYIPAMWGGCQKRTP